MKYRIEFKRSAAKALKEIPKRDQERIRDTIDSLSESLPDPIITKMKGDNPFHRIRIGDYRIVYEILEGDFMKTGWQEQCSCPGCITC